MGKKKRQVDHGAGTSSDSNDENEGKSSPSCSHFRKIMLAKVRKALIARDVIDCDDCKRDSTKHVKDDNSNGNCLLICLCCGKIICKDIHALKHRENVGSDHDITINIADWTVRCHTCNTDINPERNKQLSECFTYVKKTLNRPSSLPLQGDTDISPVRYEGSILIIPTPASPVDTLPKVRGLANLGNTCFFNAVLQCLAQTPFLLPILEEMKEPGEEFELPGGEVQIGEKKINLEPLKGTLNGWGPLTEALAETLKELQSGASSVVVPRRLKEKLEKKCPQFCGYNEHDSHELLRQLLDAVRDEDHNRYKSQILSKYKIENLEIRRNLSEEISLAVKGYGRQAGELLLRPSQVFRGELVSILQCLNCGHSTDHIEHFLDLSLPVAADKPVHRRRVSSENNDTVSKHQMKKERKIAQKRKNKKTMYFPPMSDSKRTESNWNDRSDDDDTKDAPIQEVVESGYSSEKLNNGDSACGSPNAQTSPPNPSVCSGQLEEDSVLLNGFHNGKCNQFEGHHNAGRPNASQNNLNYPPTNFENLKLSYTDETLDKLNSTEDVVDSSTASLKLDNELVNINCSSICVYQGCALETTNSKEDSLLGIDSETSPSKLKTEDDDSSGNNLTVSNGFRRGGSEVGIDTPLDSEEQEGGAEAVDDSSPDEDDGEGEDDVCEEKQGEQKLCVEATLAPRVYVRDNKFTLHSCLNQFTAQELLSGNNKVGCELCTEKQNGKGGKTVYMDASKQLLILNPPAILILHLKRFQVLRLMSKKSDEVSFPLVLDLAQFCSIKCKEAGSVRPDQTEVRYALYGVVQHSGSMHGGHYVAHVKVRPSLSRDDPRWGFLPRGPSPVKPLPTREEAGGVPPDPPPGKWYYISDSHVSDQHESRVLDSEAYILFYERIW